MRLKSLKLNNFRNYKESEINFFEGINVFYGENAQGKTNILEAIWLFTGAKSFRSSKDNLFANPMHPYTQALLSAIPVPDPDVKMNRIVLEGDLPSPANPPKGCKFHTRCSKCFDRCREEAPAFNEYEPGHFVACHLYDKQNQE
jgi:oligopeptide/dipeptide ABC transporter ATP-binding protein